jgi:hypothetical protein
VFFRFHQSAILGAALTLAACSQESPAYKDADMAVTGARVAAPAAMDATSEPAPPPPGGAPAEAGAMLAYSYSMGVKAPKTAIEPMVAAHEKKCLDAGTAVCQVLGSSVNTYGEDQVSGYLNLRAEPEWLAGFRSGIASDAEGAGGELTANTSSAEDLTQYIVDVEARLEAKRMLRDRIKEILATRQGSLADVLAAERELANVQGEIDSMTAQLAAAKARVAMSALSISYNSDPETSTSMWKPLAEAFKSFGRNSMASLADAVTFVSRTWPFFLIGLFVLWVLRAWIRGWRLKRAKA